MKMSKGQWATTIGSAITAILLALIWFTANQAARAVEDVGEAVVGTAQDIVGVTDSLLTSERIDSVVSKADQLGTALGTGVRSLLDAAKDTTPDSETPNHSGG